MSNHNPTIYDFFRKIAAMADDSTVIGQVEADHTSDTFTLREGDNIALTVDPGADTITVSGADTDFFVPIGSTTLRHQQGLDEHDINLIGGHGVQVVRNSANELEIKHVDGDTNIIWVSRSQGDDTHDGINAPVRTIKKACQLASEIAYTPTTTQTQSFADAEYLIDANMQFIKDEVIAYIAANYPALVYDTAKCARDTGYLVNAALYDLKFGGNSSSRLSAELYFEGGASVVVNNQLTETIAANTFLKGLVADILNNTAVTALQTNTSQTIDVSKIVDAGDVTSIQAGIQITIDALTAGNTNSLPALVKPVLQFTPTTIKISSGDYTEQNPIIVPDGVSLVGDSLRTVIIRPANANKNMFSLRNGSYITQITFRDHLDSSGTPDWTWNFTFGFDDILDTDYDRGSYKNLSAFKPVVTTSPYIFNSSLISFLGGSGVDVNGDLVEEPNQPAEPRELELATDTTPGLPKQGKSMIGAAYTMLTFGGTGWLIRNQAYSQLVSCFQIFAKNGVYTQNGGYVSITNSATNFGLFALRSIGQMPVAFDFDKPLIASNGIFESKQTFKVIGSNRKATEHFIIRIRNSLNVDITNNHRQTGTSHSFDSSTNVAGNLITIANHGFTGGEKVIYRNGGNKDIIGLLDRNEYYVFVANANEIGLYEDPDSEYRAVPLPTTASQTHYINTPDEEFFVDEVIDSHNVYQELVLASGTYQFTPGTAIAGDDGGVPLSGIVHSWDSGTNTLVISVEKVQIGDVAVRNYFSLTSTITQDHTPGAPVTNIALTSFENLTNLYTTEFTIGSTFNNSTFQNITSAVGNTAHLHRPSIVNSSAHTWEYAGSGIDYNALPENGGQTNADYQQYRNQEGRVYTSGTNELGDFLVGDFITAENKTGNIQFKNKVTITELDSLSLTLSDVTINEISDDIGLGDNDLNGPLHSRLVTQLAVRSFLDNRLGDFIDKSVSTNAVPSAIAQLNSAGQLNPELIPATRSFASFVINEYEGRLRISEDIPAGDSQSGDIAIENYTQTVLTLNSAVTVVKGETITQANSGATGEVKQGYTSATSIALVNTNGTFTTNTADTLSGSTTGALSTYPTVVDADTEQQDSYFLNRDTYSQFLILEPDTYSFTNGSTIVGAVSGGDGEITNYVTGVVTVVNNVGLNGGSGYNTDGTYADVALTGGNGSGVTADIVISSGTVSSVDIKSGGSGYSTGDVLSASDANIGGRTGGTAFTISVSDVEQRLFIELGSGGIKFNASGVNPDFIRDNNSASLTLNQSYTATQSFDAANDVNYTQNRITITSHGYTNGDPVKYSSGVNLPMGNVATNSVFRVKVIDANTIELYDDYDLTTQRIFSSSATGTHTLTINGVETVGSTFYFAAHGLSTGDALAYTATVPPTGITSGDYLFVGSVTTNSFTLHPSRSNALTSINGITFAKQSVTTQGTGNATLNIHDVQVNTQVNTSSTQTDNWSVLSSGNIDASNIISGIVDSSRLGTGTANSDTALFGDSEYRLVVKDITNNTADDPITLAGSFTTDGQGNEHYYGSIDIRVENAGADSSVTADTNEAYYSKGVAKFLKEHFVNNTAGEIQVKPSTSGGTVDAATLGGVGRTHYENPENFSRAVPVTLGGTNLTGYVRGDILFAGNGRDADGLLDDDLDVLSKLSIGTAGQVLNVNSAGNEPEWTSNPTLAGATFGNIQVAITNDNTIDTSTGGLTIDTASGEVSITDNVTITGNLTVQGTTTTVDSTTTQVVDPIFQIGGGTGGAALTTDDGKDRGIAFKWYDAVNTPNAEKTGFFGYDNSTGKFAFIPDATITNEVVSGTLGELANSAASATLVEVGQTTDNGTHYLTFVDSNNSTRGNEALYTDSGIAYNPASNDLSILGDLNLNGGNRYIRWEGTTANAFETFLYASDVDADRTITLPNASGTVALTSDIKNNTLTIAAGNAITVSATNTFTANSASDVTVTVNHSDTSSQASVNNSGNNFIQDITLDNYGHVTGLTSAAVSINNATITLSAGSGLTTGGNFTTNQGSNETITFNVGAGSGITVNANDVAHADTSTQASVNNSNGNVIQDVTLDGFGHVTGLASVNLDGRYSYYQSAGQTNDVAVGWRTIAVNAGSRATARFTLIDRDGGDHQSTTFYATHHYGADSNVNVLMNGYYSGSPFRYIRIKEGGTYDGAMLQVYIDKADNNVGVRIQDNFQSSGWVVKNFIADATDPGGLGNYANCTNVAEQVDLDIGGKGAMTLGSNLVAYGHILPDATSSNRNVGASNRKFNTMYATTFDGTATQAQYADLAEKYLADAEYEIGTVIMIGGEAEVTAATEEQAHSVIGVVSEAPAFLMNKDLENGTAIALKGRVKVRVQGNVQKGDRLCPSSIPGVAYPNNSRSAWSFAVALEDGVIEVEAVIL